MRLFGVGPEKVVVIVLRLGGDILSLPALDSEAPLRRLLGRSGSGSD